MASQLHVLTVASGPVHFKLGRSHHIAPGAAGVLFQQSGTSAEKACPATLRAHLSQGLALVTGLPALG